MDENNASLAVFLIFANKLIFLESKNKRRATTKIRANAIDSRVDSPKSLIISKNGSLF